MEGDIRDTMIGAAIICIGTVFTTGQHPVLSSVLVLLGALLIAISNRDL